MVKLVAGGESGRTASSSTAPWTQSRAYAVLPASASRPRTRPRYARYRLGAFRGCLRRRLRLARRITQHAGAVWRDEAEVIQIANAPDWGTMWAWLPKSSAPVLIYGVVRLWVLLGAGANSEGMRLLGALVSLGLIASLFVSCRMLTGRVPLLAMALVPFNVAVFYFGSSIRPYGLAMVLIIPCYAAFWRMAQAPTRWNVLASLLLATLSCHASYVNSCLLLGIGVAASTVCVLCRLWKRVLLILAICCFAAISLLPYIPVVRQYNDAAAIMKSNLDLPIIVGRFWVTLSEGKASLFLAWILLISCAVVFLIVEILGQRRSLGTTPSLPLYVLLAAVVTSATGLMFFLTHSYFPFFWHFTPFVALAGIVVEVAIGLPDRRSWIGLARAVACCAIVILVLPTLWTVAHLRRTNLDRISSILAERAGPKDLILVNPVWLASGFKYHYHGNTEWNTMPLVSCKAEASLDPDLAVKQLVATPNAIDSGLRKIESTLAAGHRVWIVGKLSERPPTTAPRSLPPAPQSQFGWNSSPYLELWSMQVSYCIQNHAHRIRMVPVAVEQPVNLLEDVPLLLAEGRQTR